LEKSVKQRIEHIYKKTEKKKQKIEDIKKIENKYEKTINKNEKKYDVKMDYLLKNKKLFEKKTQKEEEEPEEPEEIEDINVVDSFETISEEKIKEECETIFKNIKKKIKIKNFNKNKFKVLNGKNSKIGNFNFFDFSKKKKPMKEIKFSFGDGGKEITFPNYIKKDPITKCINCKKEIKNYYLQNEFGINLQFYLGYSDERIDGFCSNECFFDLFYILDSQDSVFKMYDLLKVISYVPSYDKYKSSEIFHFFRIMKNSSERNAKCMSVPFGFFIFLNF
jgi:hypothetical protein